MAGSRQKSEQRVCKHIILGTKLEKRLARGDEGVNPLDSACKEHDIAYTSKDTEDRYLADKKLQKAAVKRIFAKDASLGERATALGVAVAMKAKRALTKRGKGMAAARKPMLKNKNKTKLVSFNTIIKNARVAIKKIKPDNVDAAIRVAVDSIKSAKSGKRVKRPRVIPIPTRSGGILPLIPIFAGLGALGSIAGGAAGIINAINQYRNAKGQLAENKRHNMEMEAIAIGKHTKGAGFYLRTNKKGSGFYLSRSKNQ